VLWLREARRLGSTLGLLLTVTVAGLPGCAGGSGPRGRGATEGEYSFWPPAPNEPRIQFLRAYRFSSDVEKPQSAFDRIVFGAEIQVLPITKPYGVEMWNDRIYVCDITNPAVVILDLEQKQTRLMVTRGVEQMSQPTDIAIADDGMKYVIDRRLGRIFVFNAEDRHVATWGDDDLVPAGAAVHGDELFVPDFQTQSILVFDRMRGTVLRSIGGAGGGEGQFIRPLGVHVDDGGRVHVADAIVGRIQRFDADGELIDAIGQLGDTPGSFVRPKHVTVDADGVMYVVDAAFQNVQMFNADGELLLFFGGPGEFPGAMSLPAGVAVYDGDLERFADLIHPAFEAKRLVLVTNQFGANKVSVYAMGQLREGYTIEDVAPYAADLSGPLPAANEAGAPLPGGEAAEPGSTPGGPGG
jgi:sugar lactone lactonase YvrE